MSVTALKAVNAVLFALDAAIRVADSSGRLRQIASTAVAEGRTLTDAELDVLRQEARSAIDEARADD